MTDHDPRAALPAGRATTTRRRRASARLTTLLAVAALVGTIAAAVEPGAAPPTAAIPAAGSGTSRTSVGSDSGLAGQVLALAGLGPLTFDEDQSRRILGRDGRFTILLLGSDARPSHPGIRTDSIMIASVDPLTGRAAIASIPRDMAYFPLSSTRRFPQKINALYQVLARSSRNPGGKLRAIVGRALGVEIDAYAIIGFAGFRKLIGNVRGLDVYVAKSFYDRTYSIRRGRYGFGLKRGWHHLVGLKALAFARTRHADSDYARARRQQQLVAAAIGKVNARGVDSIASLLQASRGLVRTDLPLAYAPLIFAMVTRADIAHAPRVVFGPRAYATSLGGSSNMLRLSVCRAWIRRNFPPVHPGAAWLPPAPPTPSPAPAETPTPTEAPTPAPTDAPTPTPTDAPIPAP